MCLGVPGKVLELYEKDGLPMGKVEFGGIVKETCLAYTPEVRAGEYVIVHVGFAISRVDEAEAAEIFSYLEQIGAMEEMGPAAEDAAASTADSSAAPTAPDGAAAKARE